MLNLLLIGTYLRNKGEKAESLHHTSSQFMEEDNVLNKFQNILSGFQGINTLMMPNHWSQWGGTVSVLLCLGVKSQG